MPNVQSNQGVYVTYAKKEDATRAIAAIDGCVCDGKVVRASYGTTKYCSNYLRNVPCANTGCMYLHEPGEDAENYLKEEANRTITVTGRKVLPFWTGSESDGSGSSRGDGSGKVLPSSVTW